MADEKEFQPDPIPPAPAPASLDPAKYDEAQIRVLDDVEHVRTRPGMYIGGYNARGLHHLVYEIVDNSIDEALAGYCKSIVVKINADGSCTVTDDGRGIPVGVHPTEGIPTVEVVFATLGAGGKFSHDETTAYKTSGGLHGVGASVVNFVSEWFEVEVSRDGAVHHMEFARGVKTSDLKVIGKTTKTGTQVSFKPDLTLFTDEKGGVQFLHETLLNRLRELAFLNAGVEIVYEDERVGKRDTFKFDKGLTEYVQFLNEGKTLTSSVVSFTKTDPGQHLEVEVALQYSDGYNETILTFANNINNHDGGTHLSGFKTGLTNTVLKYAERVGLLKDVRPSGDDLREGLVAVVSVKIPEPSFESQTKDKLLNVEIEGFVGSAMNERLGAFLEEHPKEAKVIFEKGIMAAEAREAARKARELTRRKNSLEGTSLPGKLVDCRSKSNEDTELFLVEGDSAAGTSKAGRDSNIQAILALRGKLLNVEKANLVKMLGHEEIRTIISALGCGIRDDFNMDKRRYGKIVILTDADVDGSHIRTLLLTFFFRHMQELVRAGRIYVGQPPLYQVTRRKKAEYVLNERAMRQIYIDLGLDGTSLVVRDSENAADKRVLGREELKRVVELLSSIEEAAKIVNRRGIDFASLLDARSADGDVPVHHVVLEDREEFLTAMEWQAFREGNRLVFGTNGSGLSADDDLSAADAGEKPRVLVKKHTEMHETEELRRLFTELAAFGVDVDTASYYRPREQGVNGEYLATTYGLRNEDKTYDVAGVSQILPQVMAIGKQGIEVKRFKGLGEMNAEQLWETTLDRSKRILLRVTLHEAAEAERMFSVLMGEDVERRRQFIEEHALEVKNLDV